MKRFIEIIFFITVLIFIEGCTDNPVNPDYSFLNSDFNLRFGQTIGITGENLLITFADVTEDSRCPKDAECVWQGTAKIKLILRQNTELKTDTVQTYLPQKIINIGEVNDSYLFWVKNLAPYPELKNSISKSKYILSLNVSRFTYGFREDKIIGKTGIFGQAYIGPVSPVQKEGFISYRPFKTSFYLVNGGSDTTVVQTDSTGRFIKYLPDGEYDIVSTEHFPRISPGAIHTIVSGKMNFINIFYNSGIR